MARKIPFHFIKKITLDVAVFFMNISFGKKKKKNMKISFILQTLTSVSNSTPFHPCMKKRALYIYRL